MEKKNNDDKKAPIVLRSGETRKKSTANWSPAMDNIVKLSRKMTLGKALDELDSKIDAILYSPRKTKRLPIFEEICPIHSSS
ncbi:heat shock protein 40 [Cucumis melo var. makuwa]|uniref:Heat shock protein 40 n=2 Tax=Cucumis melo TaxID=3656 RepID=A0A5D3CRK5_CUCMM|nr:heat shock protein 40 [Cucumis melo var. makuwa]